MTAEEQVAALKERMFEYLDSVRESGVQDMMAVVPSLEAEFGLTRQEARSVLKSWILAFGEEES